MRKLVACISAGSVIGALLAFAPLSFRVSALSKQSVPRKRALLIGISKYSRPKLKDGWPDLSTGTETELLRSLLREKFSFADEDIVSLKDEQATSASIIGAIEDLISKTAAGDIAFIHFSGHGDTVKDDNGDEIDGLDEVFVPYDYVSRRDRSNTIRDDRIDALLRRLSQKKPASVMVSIDACFAGSATRDDSVVRGGASGGLRSDTESPSGLLEQSARPPDNFAYFSAARANQRASETFLQGTDTMIGVYSDALIKALTESGPKTTYRDLYERITERVLRIRRDQFPQFEGFADAIVLAGTAVEQEPFSRVAVSASGAGFATLRRGGVQGVSAGSRFKLFPAGTRSVEDSPSSVIAEGTVVAAEPLSSTLKLDRELKPEILSGAWAFETEQYYGDSAFSVAVDGLEKLPGQADFSTRLKALNKSDFSPAKFFDGKDAQSKQADFRLFRSGRDLILERKDRSRVGAFPNMSTAESELLDTLKREYVRTLIGKLAETSDPRLKVEIKLIRVTPEFRNGGGISKVTDTVAPHSPETQLRIGDYVMLEVTNKGESDMYVNILNLRSDGRVGAAFPHPRAGGGDNLIRKGARVRIPLPYLFRITAPIGPESFHAIATREPIDLSFLIDRDFRGAVEVTNANPGPLTELLLSIGSGRRMRTGLSAPARWGSGSISFNVSK